MSVFLAIFVWIFIAAILVTGIALAVKGTFWLLVVGAIAFIFGLTKYGILPH